MSRRKASPEAANSRFGALRMGCRKGEPATEDPQGISLTEGSVKLSCKPTDVCPQFSKPGLRERAGLAGFGHEFPNVQQDSGEVDGLDPAKRTARANSGHPLVRPPVQPLELPELRRQIDLLPVVPGRLSGLPAADAGPSLLQLATVHRQPPILQSSHRPRPISSSKSSANSRVNRRPRTVAVSSAKDLLQNQSRTRTYQGRLGWHAR